MPVVHLKHGNHSRRRDGMCAMEAAAYIAGEKHSDKPECVSPVIGAFMRTWNDGLPTDADRDRLLKPLLPVVLFTKTTATDEETRAWLATDWLVRVHLPTWLDLAGLTAHAAKVRALPALTSSEIALAAQQTRDATRAACDAAGAAAGDAAWAAACAATRAACDAAWDTAWAAAWATAWATTRAAPTPTVAQLQVSAQDLVRRMAAVGTIAEREVIACRLEEVLG